LSGGSFDEADAGFLAQLATVAADGEAGGLAPQTKDAIAAVIARWWQRQGGADASQADAADQGGEPSIAEMAALLAGQGDAEMPAIAVPAGDPRSGDERSKQIKDERQPQPQQGPQARDVAMPTGDVPPAIAAPSAIPVTTAPVEAAPPRTLPTMAPSGWDQRPDRPDSLPAVAKALPAETVPRTVNVDVNVTRTETHFAPVQQAAVMPLAANPVLAEKPVTPDRADIGDSPDPEQPTGGAKPVRLDVALPRAGQNPERSVTKGAADRADAEAPQRGGKGDDFTPTVPLSTRGLPHAMQPDTSPVRQIADGIAANLASRETDNSQAAPAAAPRPATEQPVKVLTIQLQPADLGTVTVRMTLKADTMDVQVEVGRRAAARLIDADRDALTSLLRSAGYHVEALTVRAVEQPSPASAPGPMLGSSDSGGPQLQPGGSQPDARASGGRPQQGQHAVPDRSSNDGEQASGDQRGAGLYV
jgi:chemotaxis protein MotD